MQAIRLIIPVGFLALALSTADAAEHKYLKAFPAAEEAMARFAIVLPDKERGEEDNFRVELIVGQTMLTDGVNQYHLGGNLEDRPLQGWGFTYYEVKKLGPAISTQIAVPPGTPPVEKFVAGPSKMIRYNSRVPIVIYAPKGAEVHYRVFAASKSKTVKPG